MMWFSSKGSPKSLVFGDVKMLWKFEGYDPPPTKNFLQVTTFRTAQTRGSAIAEGPRVSGTLHWSLLKPGLHKITRNDTYIW